MAAASTGASSSGTSFPRRYDVFLSFRGADTRRSFTDHLYCGLYGKGIHVYKDDAELERGESISSDLIQAIRNSKLSIIIFSRNYAESSWCLDELVTIFDCVKKGTQTACPVFYDVDPSEVEMQTGEYGKAFAKHTYDYKDNPDKVLKWRIAMRELANLSGWDLQNRYESEVIRDIIQEISRKLPRAFQSTQKVLVGIDRRVRAVTDILSLDSDDAVITMGIYGMAGLGKTTIAKFVYDAIRWKFERSCFLDNVGERFAVRGPCCLQEQLISETSVAVTIRSADEGIDVIKSRLKQRSLLLVLDNVNNLIQLKMLAADPSWFGKGSRIIITSRDKHLLIAYEVDALYKPDTLSDDEAFTLFCSSAFKQTPPGRDYLELSHKVLEYARGLPLAIEVLGSSLCGRDFTDWESALRKLKYITREIMDVLQAGEDRKKSADVMNEESFAPTLAVEERNHGLEGAAAEEGKANYGLVLSSTTRQTDILRCRIYESLIKWHLTHLYLLDCNFLDVTFYCDLPLPILVHLDLTGSLFSYFPETIIISNELKEIFVHGSTFPRQWLNPLECLNKLSLEDKHLSTYLNPLEGLKELSLEDKHLSTYVGWLNSLKSLKELSLEDKHLSTYADRFQFFHSSYLQNDPLKCFMSYFVLQSILPRSVEKLQFVLQLRKLGILGFFSGLFPGLLLFKAKGNRHVFEVEGQRVQQIHKIPESITSPESINVPIDVLPCYLVELDLKDCNISDDNYIFRNLTSLCSMKLLNLSGNLMTTIPECIVRLTQLQSLKLSRCKMLQSLPQLPASLEELKLNYCSSLQKVVNLPNLFTTLRLDVLNCGKLVEIQELFVLRPMETIDVDIIMNLWLIERKSSEDVEVLMFNFMTYSTRKTSLQILHECGIVSVCVPGRRVPLWFSYQMKGDSPLNLFVPSLVGDETWSLNLCVVYSWSHMSEYNFLPLLMAKVYNKTKGLKWTYSPTFVGMPSESENMLWLSHWKFRGELESGDQVDMSFVYSANFSVKGYGVDFVYEDNAVDIGSVAEAAVRGSYVHAQTLSDVDVSVYKVQRPAEEVQGTSYLLSNHHYPTSADKFWLDQFLQSNEDLI